MAPLKMESRLLLDRELPSAAAIAVFAPRVWS
jgi:hypothetical protein